MAASLLLLCCLSVCHLHITVCDAAGTAVLQNLNCSTAGNYTPSDAYASNLNQLLARIPTTKHGGFIQATVGQQGGATGTAYGLAMCFADFSLSDCLDCLATAAGELAKQQCPGSTTVVATYDRCLVRYSDAAFFGTADTDVVYTSVLPGPVANKIYQRNSPWIGALTAHAASSATRFGYVLPRGGTPNLAYIVAQCTRDLATDKCKACLDMLGSRILRSQKAVFKTPSCWLRYSSSVTFPVFPPSDAVDASNFTTPATDDATSNSTTPSTTDASNNSTTPTTDAASNSTMGSTDASNSTPSRIDKGSRRSRRLSTGATVGTVVGVTVGLPSLAALLVHYLRNRGSRRSSLHNRLEDMRSPEMTRGEGTQTAESIVQEATQGIYATQSSDAALNSILVHSGRKFSYQQLLGATENFSRTLGRGYFGEVFKGVLDNDYVAVKRILLGDEQAQGNYANEISNISQLSHPNLVPLIGSCDENDELLLVYELIPNGSLDQHLYEKEAPLQWDIRYKVVIDIAKALDHLHGQNCIHRDIKPSNVMLDEHFNAKLGDFGLVIRRIITGDLGYIDPESIRTSGRAGKSSDIYSFGVLLLEIACGIRPTCRQDQDPNANTLIQKARMSYARGALLDAVDERLDGNFVTAQVQLVMRVGLLCVQDHSTRPNCRQVLNFLSGTVPPPSPRKDQDSLAIQVDNAPDPKEYSYDQLSEATNHFANKIGSGGFADVYEGELDKISVAVKHMFRVDDKTIKEFRSEIQVIRLLSHQNLLPLVGWCANKTKLLIVYKLMRNGSLRGHLHQKPNTLQWNQGFKIITGIASAVAYLHEGPNLQTVLHRDIKPSNVMLDENYTAKLGDFGLVREIGDEVSKKTAAFGGTIHYMDPEYFRTLQASRQTDVYSFGVVALEIVLGETPKAFVTKEGQITNTFVQKTLRWYEDGTIFHKVDKRLNGNFDEDQMRRVVQAGIMCVNPDGKKRPSCTQVKNYLEGRHASEFEPSPPSSSMIPQEELIGWGFHAACNP